MVVKQGVVKQGVVVQRGGAAGHECCAGGPGSLHEARLCLTWFPLVCSVRCSPLPRPLQFKHQPLSVQSGDLLNHDQEVVHNDAARQMHEEEEEEVRAATTATDCQT